MGHTEREFWLNDAWGETRADRQSGAYYPYTPDLIAGREFDLSEGTIGAAAEAQARIRELGASASRAESVARVLIRSEALSSSRMEGLELPAVRLLEAEELRRMGVGQSTRSVAAAVLGNTDMMMEAVRTGASGEMSVDTIREMHRLLLQGTDIEDQGGKIRTAQNWIGGSWTSPVGAAYVPPQPHKVPALLEDLVEFCNTSRYPAVIRAAIAHAQFETIHPFADGNGRVGRALIHAIADAGQCVPPISLVLLADKQEYVDRLASYRSDDVEQELVADGWVRYFAKALTAACDRAEALDDVLDEVRDHWRTLVSFRRGSAGERLLDVLVTSPVITVGRAAELTGRSGEACRLAIGRLMEAGILAQRSKNRKSGLYVATDVVEALTSFERATRTRGGSTHDERPAGHVPQRARKRVRVPRL